MAKDGEVKGGGPLSGIGTAENQAERREDRMKDKSLLRGERLGVKDDVIFHPTFFTNTLGCISVVIFTRNLSPKKPGVEAR